MKSVLYILVSSVCYTVVQCEELLKGKYPRYIEFPDGDGVMHPIDLEAEPDMKYLAEIEKNPANNEYFLFTRYNPYIYQRLEINNAESITASNFNARNPTVVIAHGWLSDRDSSINLIIRDAFLRKYDVNVIVLDWSRLASSFYVTSVMGVPAVGRGLGRFLRYLNDINGASFDSMHLIGFSLGAHLVGIAGLELDGKVARVTGLDPAGPLWEFNANRLNASAAKYVEAIHTDSSIIGLGIGSAVGDVDFYPNGGSFQPGCYLPVCNHNRAFELFAATVTYNHLVGRQCANSIQIALNTCRGSNLHMGNADLKKVGLGLYRVNTKGEYPF